MVVDSLSQEPQQIISQTFQADVAGLAVYNPMSHGLFERYTLRLQDTFEDTKKGDLKPPPNVLTRKKIKN